MKPTFKPNGLFFLGLAALVLANVSHFILTREIVINKDTSDFVFGGLMGIAIAAMLLSIVVSKKKLSKACAMWNRN